MKSSYWNGDGKHQQTYEELWNKLVPMSGPATTRAGELLRAAARLYYRWFNDGDKIERFITHSAADSSAMNAWGFIYIFNDPKTGFQSKALAWDILDSGSESAYEEALEKMVDAVIEYVANAPEEPNDTDFTDDKYTKAFGFEIEQEDGEEEE